MDPLVQFYGERWNEIEVMEPDLLMKKPLSMRMKDALMFVMLCLLFPIIIRMI